MKNFNTLDIRGLSFFSAFELMSKEFGRIKKNGILELILDRKKNFTDVFQSWATSKGYKITDMESGHRMIRLFIIKAAPVKTK